MNVRFWALAPALIFTVACGDSSRRGGGGPITRSDGGVRNDGGGSNNDGAIDPDGGGGQNDGAPGTDSGCGDPCGEQNANCGTLFDLCFNSIVCGTCPSDQVCGGGGEPNVCSADCVPDCPSGWSCNAGICGGGSRTMLDLDVEVPPRVTISGRLLKNNAAIAESGCINVSFSSLDGFGGISAYACSDSGWSYTVDLWAGNYQVAVYDSSDTIAPATTLEVIASQNFAGSMSNFNLNITAPARITISGTVRRNGAAISPIGSCATLIFANQNGLTSPSTYACSDSAFSYTVDLWAGDYAVFANDGSGFILPFTSQKVVERAFTSSMTNFILDVIEPARLMISGTVRKNGQPITENTCIQLNFTNLDGFDNQSVYACRESSYAFDVPSIHAGNYRIDAYDTSGIVLPTINIEVAAQRTFNSSMNDVLIDIPGSSRIMVSGTVLRNGAAIAEEGCAVVYFNSASGFGSFNSYACSDSSYAYSVEIFAGRYTVTVHDPGGAILPSTQVEAVAERDFNSAMENFTVDVRLPPLVTISGALRKNGQPITDPVCINLVFVNQDGLEQKSTYACGEVAGSYSIQLYAGNYDVIAYDSSGIVLPVTNIEVISDRAFNSSMSNVIIDVQVPPRVSVSGRVLKNGQAISAGFGCVTVIFSSREGSDGASTYACGESGWTYMVELYAGVYRVAVYDSSEQVLPSLEQVVIQNIRLQ